MSRLGRRSGAGWNRGSARHRGRNDARRRAIAMLPIQDTIPRRTPPVATYILILINGLVFMFELTLSPAMLESLFYLFGMVPARYTHPAWALVVGFPIDDYWPFLTSMF